MTDSKRILILGVGNILFTDEGVGVHVVNRMREEYDFSDNVTLMDGGNLGMRLMEPIMESDLLIVVDAVLGDGDPGSLYRLTGDDLRKSLAFINSLHQTDLVDTLIYCEILGNRPEAVIVGIEPFDFQSSGVELSPTLAGHTDAMIEEVLREVRAAGGEAAPKAAPSQHANPVTSYPGA